MQKTVSEKLIALRGERTQTEIAEAIGVARSTYSMYESGQRIPRDEVKIRLAELYDVTVQELFFD